METSTQAGVKNITTGHGERENTNALGKSMRIFIFFFYTFFLSKFPLIPFETNVSKAQRPTDARCASEIFTARPRRTYFNIFPFLPLAAAEKS